MIDFEKAYFREKEVNGDILFSILIPSYGNLEFLDDCLKSINSQTFKSYEIIICDQGNTNSSKIASKYNNIKIIRLERPSLYLARLKLIKEANGQYVIFSDNDDLLHPSALEILNTTIIDLNYPDMIIYKLDKFFNGEINGYFDYTDYNFQTNIIKDCTSFILNGKNKYNSLCQKCFKRNKVKWLYSIDIFQSEDICASLQLCSQMKSFYFLDATLYFYRIHNQNGTKVWKFNRVLDISKFYYYVFNEFPIYLEKKSGDFCRFISTFIIQGLRLKQFGKTEWNQLFSDKYFLECYQKIKNIKNVYKNKPIKDKILIYCLRNKKYYLMKMIAIVFKIKK